MGDTLTVVFDLATNRGGGGVTTTVVPVDEMLTFSHSLGAEATAAPRGTTHAYIYP